MKLEVSPTIVIILGAVFQVIGFALLGTSPVDKEVGPAIYGYEIMAGVGLGISIAVSMVLPPYIVEKRDQGMDCYSPVYLL